LIETKQRSDVRPVDVGLATLSSGEVAEQASTLGHFTGTSSPARTRDIRFSKYAAIFSDFARSAFTYSELYFMRGAFLYGETLWGRS
jgi:hypothetical protein